jgi:hypothetical protein
MTVKAGGELRLSQTKVSTPKADLLANETVHGFLCCRHADYHSTESCF